MNPRDYLQCDSCFKNLDDFMALQEGASEEAIKLLEEYTLFCEIRRLKEQQVKSPSIVAGLNAQSLSDLGFASAKIR